MSATWTVGGVTITWLRSEESGVPVERYWSQEPNEAVRPLLGTHGDVDIAVTSYTPYEIAGAFGVETTIDAQAMRMKNGTVAAVSDGLDTWQARVSVRVFEWVGGDGWHVGELTLTRLRA